jgi:hypothetical protein
MVATDGDVDDADAGDADDGDGRKNVAKESTTAISHAMVHERTRHMQAPPKHAHHPEFSKNRTVRSRSHVILQLRESRYKTLVPGLVAMGRDAASRAALLETLMPEGKASNSASSRHSAAELRILQCTRTRAPCSVILLHSIFSGSGMSRMTTQCMNDRATLLQG